ncbi:MAG: hypothetical protein J3Q66DRAFT_357182 [Benniella sp.]|nr:MAG: hypothetical protein J3Q66DRAFT_357182 [Benniella sp.]
MNTAQKEYLTGTTSNDVSLVAWAKLSEERTADEIDRQWTKGIAYLNSLGEDGQRSFSRFSKLSREQRMEYWEDALQYFKHKQTIQKSADRQTSALADSRATEMEQDASRRSSQARDLKRGAGEIAGGDQNRRSNKEPKVKHNNSRPISASHASTGTTTPASPSPSSSTSTRKPHTTTATTTATTTTPSSIPATDKDRTFDITKAKRLECIKNGFDVGAAFLALQQEAAIVVNNRQQKLTLANFHQFISTNYIWDMRVPLSGMKADVHKSIRLLYQVPRLRLSNDLAIFCRQLVQELEETGSVLWRPVANQGEDDILLIFKNLSKKLPDLLTPPQKSEKNEDTFSHGALDVLLSTIFPENDKEFTFSWANRPCRGSRERRGDPYKPDITIIKQTSDVGFGEIKAPKDDRCMRFFLEDEWALLSLAKDTIDLYARESRGIVRIALLQVFGYQMNVSQLQFEHGLYFWNHVGAAYLPRDKSDCGGLLQCYELLLTFKRMLDDIL